MYELWLELNSFNLDRVGTHCFDVHDFKDNSLDL